MTMNERIKMNGALLGAFLLSLASVVAFAKPSDIETRVAEALNERAFFLKQQGNTKDAKILFQESIVVSPNTSSAKIAQKALLELEPKAAEEKTIRTPNNKTSAAQNPWQNRVRRPHLRAPKNPYGEQKINRGAGLRRSPADPLPKTKKTPHNPYAAPKKTKTPLNPYE